MLASSRNLFSCARSRYRLLQTQRMHFAPMAGVAPAAAAIAIDKAAFTQTIPVPALRVPAQKCSELMKRLRGYTYERPKVKCVAHDPQHKDMRLLLMREGLAAADLPTELQQLIEADNLQWTDHHVQLEYCHWAADDVLRKLLPEGMEVPTSFEMVGHIAHLNLRAEQLPYKALIGAVIVDKNPQIRTVVNKLGSIENEFRVFQMEVLAGEPSFETEVTQHKARFRLDFSQVYWNTRLETEHHRLVGLFKPGEVVVDIMAGVGPFAIPAGLAGCVVYANDLNPASSKYLVANIHLNKVANQVHPFNMDGRAFVRLMLDSPGGPAEQARSQAAAAAGDHPPPPTAGAAADSSGQVAAAAAGAAAAASRQPAGQQQRPQKQQAKRPPLAVPPPWPPGFAPPAGGLLFQHAIMNLPASAVEFLDAFHGAFDPAAWQGRQLPWVHCYTFMKNETEQDVIKRVEAALGGPLDAPAQIHYVRDVAPNKLMLCVSFRVPAGVAFAGRGSAAEGGQVGAAASGGAGTPASPQQEQQQQSKKPRIGS